MRPAAVAALVSGGVLGAIGCQWILEFEDHTLAPPHAPPDASSNDGTAAAGGARTSNPEAGATGGRVEAGAQPKHGDDSSVRAEVGPAEASEGGRADSGRDAAAARDAGATVCPVCELGRALVHRYRFDRTGTVLEDSVGDAHGRIVGAALSGKGDLTLTGGDAGDYVDLPDGLISGLRDVTIELWATWHGGEPWQRLFDFGDRKPNGTGRTFLALCPRDLNDVARAVLQAGDAGVVAAAPRAFPVGVQTHAAVVLDESRGRLGLYIDGAFVVEIANRVAPSAINDVNDWLGRSQYRWDPGVSATLHEFRIYDRALDAEQIQASFAGGPDLELGAGTAP